MTPDDELDIYQNIDAIRRAMLRMRTSRAYQTLKVRYEKRSFFDLAGVARREEVHSNILAWLLDPNASHALGDLPLRRLLDVAVLTVTEGNQSADGRLDAWLVDLISTGAYTLTRTRTQTEYPVPGGRLDILVEARIHPTRTEDEAGQHLTVVIENKVRAREHKSQSGAQTRVYEEWFRGRQAERETNAVVPLFLTPCSTLDLMELEQAECESTRFIQINYQSIMDHVLRPCLVRDISDTARSLLEDYILCLGRPPLHETDSTRGDLVMAIGDEERLLLTEFWNENEKLLRSALYAIANDPEQDKDTRDQVRHIVDNLRTSKKDYSRYNVLLDGEVVHQGIRKTDLAKQVVHLLLEQGLVDDVIFRALREDKSSSFHLLKCEAELSTSPGDKRRYRMGQGDSFERDGKTWYVSGNWGENNLPKFADFLRQHAPRVTFDRGAHTSPS